MCRSLAEGGRRCYGYSCTKENQRARQMVSRTRRALTAAQAAGDTAKVERLREKLKAASVEVTASKSATAAAQLTQRVPVAADGRPLGELDRLEFERELTEARQGMLDLRRQRDRAQRAGARPPSGPGVDMIEQRARDAETENARRIDESAARLRESEAHERDDFTDSTADDLRKQIMTLMDAQGLAANAADKKHIEDQLTELRQRLRAHHQAVRKETRQPQSGPAHPAGTADQGGTQIPGPSPATTRWDRNVAADIVALNTQDPRYVSNVVNPANVNAGSWVHLADLRERLRDRGVSDEAIDRELRRMHNEGKVTLAPDSNRKTLTDKDHRGSIQIGGQPNHLVCLSPEMIPATAPATPATSGEQPTAAPSKPVPRRSAAAAKRRKTGQDKSRERATTTPTPGPKAEPTPVSGNQGPAGPVSGQMSSKPIAENGWGYNGSLPICYHDDGPVGTAVQYMGADARMDVDGEPLANVLGRVATDVVQGRRTAEDGLGQYKAIRDRLPQASAARRQLDSAIRQMDAPASPVPPVPKGTPEPLRKLVHDLHAVPIARAEPERELEPLLSILNNHAGKPIGGRTLEEIKRLANKRHESYGDCGKFEIDRAVEAAVKALDRRRR